MRFAFAAVLSILVTAVVGSLPPGLPKCASSCITANNYGGCNALNIKCICSNRPYLTNLSCCVSKQCDPQQQKNVIQFADNFCGAVGVTNLPTKAGCTGAAAKTAASKTTSSASTSTSPGAAANNYKVEKYAVAVVVAGALAAL